MIITIDGPAGSGKTTIGRMLAARLGFTLVDTGLFYRAATVEARRRKIEPDDAARLVPMVRELRIDINTSPDAALDASLVCVDGRDVTREALDPAIARDLAQLAQVGPLRELLKKRQRAFGGNLVMLGRDIGTVIFPEADVKFFFTASTAERAARRRRELDDTSGRPTPDAVMESEVEARDRADEGREVSPLRPAVDAIIVATEGKSVHQVFQEVMAQLPAGH